MENNLENTQKGIMQLMVSIAQNDREKAVVQLDEIRAMILDGLDYATEDQELVQWGKFLKIVDELEAKVAE